MQLIVTLQGLKIKDQVTRPHRTHFWLAW